MPLLDISNTIQHNNKDHIIKGAKLILDVLSTIRKYDTKMTHNFCIQDSSLSIFNVDYVSTVCKLNIWKNYKVEVNILPVRGSEIPGVFLNIKSTNITDNNHTIGQVLTEIISSIESINH